MGRQVAFISNRIDLHIAPRDARPSSRGITEGFQPKLVAMWTTAGLSALECRRRRTGRGWSRRPAQPEARRTVAHPPDFSLLHDGRYFFPGRETQILRAALEQCRAYATETWELRTLALV